MKSSKNHLTNKGKPRTVEERNGKGKFDVACQQIEQSVKKYISTHGLEKVDDDQEEEETPFQQATIIGRVLGTYKNTDDLHRTHHHLQEAFRSGALVCLICIDNIKRNDAIWNCEECFCGFHLDCIQKWAKDSVYLQFQADEADEEFSLGNSRHYDVNKKSYKWSCPKCRLDYPQSKIPSEYKCYCGKQKNPQFDPWLIPHTCGERCGKKLRPDCGHACLLLCHPGPCPPCPTMMLYPCHCANSAPQMRRCSAKTWSCGSICNRLLACKQHKCTDGCHSGQCPTCPRVSRQKCQCGKTSETRPCSDLHWRCDKVCGRKFSCGHHTCTTVCHKGACGSCPHGGERTCPCGKKSYTLPCTESVPTCGDTCLKPLACDIHFCAERCHKGSCPSCLQFRVKKCLCGAREKELPCSKVYTCEVKCKKLRDCRKHACNRKCCTGDCPPCDHICGKTLGCGQHKCESRCHQGRCYPCAITHKVSCSCGETSNTVPCGREKKTSPPKCNIECKKRPDCHHPKSEPHHCHAGRCPQCKIVCDLKMKCGHICPAPCHDAVPIKIVDQHKRAGPWERVVAPQIEIHKQPCPPCMVKVRTTCYGRHEIPDWPCSELRPYSCGRKCGRQLNCSHHTCEKECHLIEGALDKVKQGVNCEPCHRVCSQPRLEGCLHGCGQPCHVGPCPPCNQKVRMQCHCNLLQIVVECYKWNTANLYTKEKMRCCTNQCSKVLSCGHQCQKMCHSGKCGLPTECQKKVSVRCPCKRIRKEFQCNLVASGKSKLLCDDVCRAKAQEKKKRDEEEKQKQEEIELEKSKKELEEYERFLQGKRKKKKKKSDAVMDETLPWWKSNIFVLGIGIFITSSLIYFVLFSST